MRKSARASKSVSMVTTKVRWIFLPVNDPIEEDFLLDMVK
jgi:hypothetical protein